MGPPASGAISEVAGSEKPRDVAASAGLTQGEADSPPARKAAREALKRMHALSSQQDISFHGESATAPEQAHVPQKSSWKALSSARLAAGGENASAEAGAEGRVNQPETVHITLADSKKVCFSRSTRLGDSAGATQGGAPSISPKGPTPSALPETVTASGIPARLATSSLSPPAAVSEHTVPFNPPSPSRQAERQRAPYQISDARTSEVVTPALQFPRQGQESQAAREGPPHIPATHEVVQVASARQLASSAAQDQADQASETSVSAATVAGVGSVAADATPVLPRQPSAAPASTPASGSTGPFSDLSHVERDSAPRVALAGQAGEPCHIAAFGDGEPAGGHSSAAPEPLSSEHLHVAGRPALSANGTSPSSASTRALGSPGGVRLHPAGRNSLRPPYWLTRETEPPGTVHGAQRACLVGAQRASPARRASWWGGFDGEPEPRQPLSSFWRERGKRLKGYNGIAAEEVALRSRPPRGTEQKVVFATRGGQPHEAAVASPYTLGGGQNLEAVVAAPAGVGGSERRHLEPGRPSEEDLLAFAEAQEAIRELEATLAEQEVRARGENMLKEGCIAYQDESIRLLKAHIRKLSEDLECYAASNAFERKETAGLLRHLRLLRRLRGARQGSIEGLQILYRKLEAAREGVRLPTHEYDMPLQADPEGRDGAPSFPSGAPAQVAPQPQVLQAQTPQPQALPPPSSAAVPPPKSGRLSPLATEQPGASQSLPASSADVQSSTLEVKLPEPARSADLQRSSPSRPAALESQPPAPAKPLLVDSATEMSEAGFDELLGEREEKRRHEEEERQRMEMEVRILHEQTVALREQQRQEEEMLRQQQAQLELLREQERLLKAQEEEQEEMQKRVVARLEAEALDQNIRESRREELRQLVRETTTPYPFAPSESRRRLALACPDGRSLGTLPASPMPRTFSPYGYGAAGGAAAAESAEYRLHLMDGGRERDGMLSARSRSPSPSYWALLTKEEAEAREDLRNTNELLQKKCTELHAQITYLQMAGAGLSREQLEYLETQLAEQKAYAEALEKQNKELVEMAEEALKEQSDALQKEWEAKLNAVQQEKDQATAAIKGEGEKARANIVELQRKADAAERTKDDALSRLVMSERLVAEAEEGRKRAEDRVKQREQDVESLRQKLTGLEAELGELRKARGVDEEGLLRQISEKDRVISSLRESTQLEAKEKETLKKEVEQLKMENESAKSVMRSQVASLAQQLERDQQEKEEVISFMRQESHAFQAQASEAEASCQLLEDKCRKEQERVTALEEEKKTLQSALLEMKERQSKILQDEAQLKKGTEGLNRSLAEKALHLEQTRQSLASVERDLAASRAECAKALEDLKAEKAVRQEEQQRHKEELEKLKGEGKKDVELQSQVAELQRAHQELERKAEEAEKRCADAENKRAEEEKLRNEAEEKYAKLSEMNAKQHFEREKFLQKHLQEKDVLKQTLSRMVEENSDLQKRFENELDSRNEGFKKELETSQATFAAELKQATATAEAALTRQATLEENFKEELSSVKKQHESQLSSVKKSYEKEVEQTKKALLLQKSMSIEGLNRRHQEEIQALRNDAQRALAEAKKEYELALAAHKEQTEAALAKAKAQYEEALRRQTEEHDALKKAHAKDVERLSKTQVEKLEEHRKKNEETVEELKRRSAADLHETKERMARSAEDYMNIVKEQREKADKAVATTKKLHAEEIERLKTKFKRQEEDLRSEIERYKKNLELERRMHGTHSDRFRQTLQESIMNLQHEIDTITRKLEEACDKNQKLESENADLLKVKEDLEREKVTIEEERGRTADGHDQLERRLKETLDSVKTQEKKIEDLTKTLNEKEGKLAELRHALEKEKADGVAKDERLKKAVESARLVKNQEMKQREIANSLKSQLAAKEKALADLEEDVDHLQDMLRSKDHSDLEAMAQIKRKASALEFDLEEARTTNAELRKVRDKLAAERRESTEKICKLQEEIDRLTTEATRREEDPKTGKIGNELAHLEKQVHNLEMKLEEQVHLEAKIRAEARHFEEEARQKSREIERLKDELSITREKVTEANQRMRKSLEEYTREQEDLRSRLSRDFARKEELLQARLHEFQMKLGEQREDRNAGDSCRIRELEALVARLSSQHAGPLSASVVEDLKCYFRRAVDSLLQILPAFGDGEAISLLITQMHPVLSTKEVVEALRQLAPWTPASVLETLVERLVSPAEARAIFEHLVREASLKELSPEAVQLASSLRSLCRSLRGRGAKGLSGGTQNERPNKAANSADTEEQLARFVERAPPLESLHLLKTIGDGLPLPQLTALLESLLPRVPHESVASLLTCLFPNDALEKVGDALGEEFENLLREFGHMGELEKVVQLLSDGVKQIKAIYCSTSPPPSATSPGFSAPLTTYEPPSVVVPPMYPMFYPKVYPQYPPTYPPQAAVPPVTPSAPPVTQSAPPVTQSAPLPAPQPIVEPRQAPVRVQPRPAGPRVFNVCAKLSYKLLAQKKPMKAVAVSPHAVEAMQRTVSESSTN
ncbi:hypothetical protein BESB_015080 [Besnoitia besnoiti]|uniref:G protein gamma domain-containing protein n=1 Tax=Besnoitia besnoiti TaxID=94643 RepID=A0A2A9M4K2_BESBE|nr:hypothetical protein BESB_015080 [Besnoitia besnoiti]PFH32895.1 hypothetical protein BESB_015080 [Besnoitia besnoiti]